MITKEVMKRVIMISSMVNPRTVSTRTVRDVQREVSAECKLSGETRILHWDRNESHLFLLLLLSSEKCA